MRHLLQALVFAAIFTSIPGLAHNQEEKSGQQFYELRIYHFSMRGQDSSLHGYLAKAFLPAIQRVKTGPVGIFESVENDTARIKKIYVLVPYTAFDQVLKVPDKLQKDKSYKLAGTGFLGAEYNKAPYDRIETILLKAFRLSPRLQTPKLSAPKNERIYELRSYESATEDLYRNKVEMFNEGGEIALFQRLGFNAVFYGEVISGGRMPNLMYMTTFENKQSRDAHWKTFVDDPEWKKLSALPQYRNNVSKADIILLRPTSYSEY